MAQSKRYLSVAEVVSPDEAYNLEDAVRKARETATARFDETVELAARLGIDPKQADQQVRGTVVLPKGTGKAVRVIVFAQGEDVQAAEEAGAEIVGGEDLVKRIQEGFLDFDVALATPDMMRFVGRLGKILGPRGLMPNPKAGTVTRDVRKGVEEFKAGKIEYRANREGVLHAPIGKASFPEEDLLVNLKTLIQTLMRAKPAAAKGTYLRSLHLSPTMGPGIRLDTAAAAASARET